MKFTALITILPFIACDPATPVPAPPATAAAVHAAAPAAPEKEKKEAAGVDFEKCSTITPDQLNKKFALCGDKKLTAECLENLGGDGVKSLNHACLDSFSTTVLDNFTSKICQDLSHNKAENIPKTERFWRAFISKNDWKTNSAATLLEHVVTNHISFLQTLMSSKSFPTPLLVRFFSANMVKKLTPTTCEKFTKDMALAMESDAFSGIKPGCLEVIRPEFFEGINEDFMKNINPKAMGALNAKQANKIRPNAAKGITEAQADNWGPTPSLPKVTATEGADYDKQKKEAREAAQAHPCYAANKWRTNLSGDAKKAMMKRCSDVWDNGSAGLMVRFGYFTISLAFIGYLALSL